MIEKAGAPRSAGLLVYRRAAAGMDVLAGHMGGPFWARKDARAWSFPKGGIEAAEEPLQAALREFEEETGLAPPPPPYRDLGVQRQRSGKEVRLLAVEADLDITGFRPGTFTMVRGGRPFEVPELDRLAWLDLPRAEALLTVGQVPFLTRLRDVLGEHA